MIKLKQAVIVEGKYDKIKLSSILDAVIIPTNGFSIYKDKQLRLLIKTIAEKNGIIILTDSDSAGFQIRNFVKSIAQNAHVTNVYIPDIYGKEKRKTAYSKEGKLGVEGVSTETLLKAFEKAGLTGYSKTSAPSRKITKTDFYEHGLSGTEHAAYRRKRLIQLLCLPEHLSANALLDILNSLLDYGEYMELLKAL